MIPLSYLRRRLHTIRLRLVRVLRYQAEVQDKLPRRLVISLQLLEVDNKIILDSENRVGGKVRVIVGVDLRCAGSVSFSRDLENRILACCIHITAN